MADAPRHANTLNFAHETKLMSPLSLRYALMMTLAAASGRTADEIVKLVDMGETEEDVVDTFGEFNSTLKECEDVLWLANSVWYANAVPHDEFLSIMESVFDARPCQLDTRRPGACAARINKWVATKTRNKITDIVDATLFNQLTRFILVNALYFNAKWRYPFAERTHPGDFCGYQVAFMHNKTNGYEWDRNDDYAYVRLPYKCRAPFEMICVMPSMREGAECDPMATAAAIRASDDEREKKEVILFLPKWKHEHTIDNLKALLGSDMAMFRPSRDFERGFASATVDPMAVKRIIQKVYINVTQKGTEAAAATAVAGFSFGRAAKQRSTPVLRFNKPFYYTIYGPHDCVIVAGWYRGPSDKASATRTPRKSTKAHFNFGGAK